MKIHYKIKNSRMDFLHKLSTKLVNKYNAISIEDLNMKGMSQALNLGKSVSDNGWGMFTTMLKYKTELAGKQLVKIDKFYPSSKTCYILRSPLRTFFIGLVWEHVTDFVDEMLSIFLFVSGELFYNYSNLYGDSVENLQVIIYITHNDAVCDNSKEEWGDRIPNFNDSPKNYDIKKAN